MLKIECGRVVLEVQEWGHGTNVPELLPFPDDDMVLVQRALLIPGMRLVDDTLRRGQRLARAVFPEKKR